MDNIILHCCFIKEQYFLEHVNFIKMLDSGNANKQSKRTHLCLAINFNGNSIYVPLRNNLGDSLKPYGKIGFPVPSPKRPNAGLDYRYSLVINDKKYIEYHEVPKLPKSQYDILEQNYSTIESEINIYISRYIKVAKKNRVHKEPLFRESSLINFHPRIRNYWCYWRSCCHKWIV